MREGDIIQHLGDNICFELSKFSRGNCVPVRGSVLRIKDKKMRPCSDAEVDAMCFLVAQCRTAPPIWLKLYNEGFGV